MKVYKRAGGTKHPATQKKEPDGTRPYQSLIHLIAAGILVSALTMLISLFAYLQPGSLKRMDDAIRNLSQYAARHSTGQAQEAEAAAGDRPVLQLDEKEPDQSPLETVPHLPTSGEPGQIEDIYASAVPAEEAATYTVMLDTAMGPMLYYNQGDSRWGDYLYGGQDPMKQYGCGPTAVAMIINGFSAGITPREAADWASANGFHAPQGGSYHGLIDSALTAYGFQVDSIKDKTADHVTELLESGHILIALMGEGVFTDNGHFLLITESLGDGKVRIADPNSYGNCTKEWNLQLLLSELKKSSDSGAPLWAVSYSGK